MWCSSIKGENLVKRTSVKGHLEKEERMERRAEQATPQHRKDHNRTSARTITVPIKVSATHTSCTYSQNNKKEKETGSQER